MKQTILVVDDEPKILKILEHSLRREGFEVVKAADGEEAVMLAQEKKPDLIVLDLMLPKIDGFEVCRRVRKSSDVPILVLSAKGSEVDKIVGFQLGVDDYLTKPFSPAELVLRVKAILRRASTSEIVKKRKQLVFPGIKIDRSTHTVEVAGKEINLTVKEFELLWLLASHPRQVFTREQLLDRVWDGAHCGEEGSVTVLVRRLREKIEPDPANPQFIKTVWGLGYKFETDDLKVD
ncbi:response regulator transcription factor [Calderihabitans maritimus]|uniref:Stage 0 sporulation protein A homolog n=1 Tax=Calderihabitans maritimus TaxID=1246530 RepID=A0A1Z5HT55_9FIRM|nr:response regulator transcription factor [Calderihabitans maritimus]GAW92712.1 two component transcriptional regulator, winged helix family [Calderihabitans maritimus]